MTDKEILALLERIDDGYVPTDEEKKELDACEELEIIGFSLTSLPESIGNLTNLQSLYIRVDSLTTLPDWIGNLTNLQSLGINGDSLSTLPESIGNLTNLQTLGISGDSLTFLPDWIGNLTNLQTLGIRVDSLTTLPDWIGNLTNLQSLSIIGNSLTTLPESIGKLTNLQSLVISDTSLTTLPESIGNLTNLQKLDIRRTPLTTLPDSIGNLTNLQSLVIRVDSLTTLPDWIGNLTNLQSLYISFTSISSLPDWIGNLTNLQSLSISGDSLTTLPESIGNLTNLQSLGIRGNTLTTLPDWSGNLTNLQKLDISRTSLTTLPESIGNLTNLQSLDINGNSLATLPESIGNLTNLQKLDISGNSITSIPESIGNLINLKKLDLSGLTLDAIPKSIGLRDMKFTDDISDYLFVDNASVFLNNTTLTEQPISFFLETPNLIPDLYAEQVPLHESKVIFLGDGGEGKSYTIKRIMHGGEPETEQNPYITSETPGVEIIDMPASYGDENFTVHFWDFGGQEILHSMHRCFLTEETGYVVVVKTRENASQKAREWLRNIHAFAPKSSVLMFLNCWENADPHRSLDDAALKDEFPQMLDGSVRLSAKTAPKEEFNASLTNRILQMAADTEGNKKKIPKLYKNVIAELRKKTKANGHCVSKEEYREICRHNGINLDKEASLLTFLNNIGVCYSYHIGEDKQELAEYSLLDPTWLTKALYAIIREAISFAEYGIVPTYQIIYMLGKEPVNQSKDSEYTRPIYDDVDECQYIFDVAEAHDLCFRMGEDKLFFPALCKDKTPLEEFPDKTEYGTPIQYRLKYKYLPDSVVHKLMVRCYKKDMSVKRCWLKGMILASIDDTFKAVVRMNDDEKTLAIDVYAKNGVDAKPYVLFKPIRDQVLEINGKLGLTAKEVIKSGEDTFAVKALLNSYEKNIQEISGDESDTLYNPAELLGRFFRQTVVRTEDGEVRQTFIIFLDESKHISAEIGGDTNAPILIGDDGTLNNASESYHSVLPPKERSKKK